MVVVDDFGRPWGIEFSLRADYEGGLRGNRGATLGFRANGPVSEDVDGLAAKGAKWRALLWVCWAVLRQNTIPEFDYTMPLLELLLWRIV